MSLSVGGSLQYTKKEQVINAYQLQEIPSWAIAHRRQFLFKYIGEDLEEGAEQLEKILEDLQNSAAVYTLRLYEKTNGERITDKTPYDLSFNFRFKTESENYLPGLGGSPREILPLFMQKLETMQEEISALRREREEESEEDTEPQEDTIGKITQLLSNPAVMAMLQKFFPAGSPTQVPAQLSGIGDEEKKIQAALEILRAADPQLGSHLLKLAQVAQNDKQKFSGLISMIDLL